MWMIAFDEIFIDKTKYGTKVQTSEYEDYGENIICNIELENENKENFIEDIQEQKVKVLENKELCQRLIKKK